MKESVGIVSGSTRPSRLVRLIHIGFILIGVVNTLLGPILPLLSVRWRLDDTQAGSLFFVQSVAAIVGSALTGPLIRRFGFRSLLIGGFGLMSASTACLGFGSRGLGVIWISGVGLSLGLTIPTINLLISELNPTRRAAALNLLNLAWGVGAVTGPVLIPTLARATGLSFALIIVAMPVALIATFVARSAGSLLIDPPDESGEPVPRSTAARLWLRPYPLLTAALVFVNIGTESAMGGWIASYVQRLAPSSQLSWAAAPSLFWAGLLAGRAAAPVILRHVREVKMVLFGMFVAAGGMLVVLLSSATGLVLLGVSLAGLGLAPAFPTTIALFTGRFGRDAARLTGTLFMLAGLGAAVFPWIVGAASTHYHGLRVGLIVPLVGGLLMLAIHGAIMATLSRDGAVGGERE
ncbi:MAG: MFS transporter [Pyrinomonadaceae bacterium]